MSGKGITFFYRTPYEGPLGKRHLSLPDASVLDFFRRALEATATKDASTWLKKELGCEVYGLDTFFDSFHEGGDDDEDGEERPALPTRTRQLRSLLDEHLYLEGEFRLDDHSLRVLTDDDEVQLVFCFFDRTADDNHIAWLTQDSIDLPKRAAKKGGFGSPVKCAKVLPAARNGEGGTWACLLSFYDSESIPYEPPPFFENVRLPELAAHLRNTIPRTKPRKDGGEFQDTWPFELRLLRAMVDEEDTTIGPALKRCARYPLLSVGGTANTTILGVGEHGDARAEFVKAAGGHALPVKSRIAVSVSDHVAVLPLHVSKPFWQQWILFDDLWATANEDLAASLLRYASRWDPFE